MNEFRAFLFLLMLTELCIGGGGHFTALGPVSLRMILFSISFVISVVFLIKEKSFPFEMGKWAITFALFLSIGIAVGIVNHNPRNLIFEDVKPLCYFFVLPFFYLTVDQATMTKAIKIIKASSAGMAVIFIVLLLLINSGVIHFLDFYQATVKSQEIFYRGEATFFYKGFLFFGIGAIFYFFTGYSKLKKYFLPVLVMAIILSVTRGLLLSLAFTFSVYFLVIKSYGKAALGIILSVIIGVWGADLILAGSKLFDAERNGKNYDQADPNLLGDRNYSDNGRITQAREVWQRTSFASALIGHGFGGGTPSRPIHMEVSYLEIFHKQGFVGLIFWAAFGGQIFIFYKKAPASAVADAFFYSSLFIFIESLTNQYINNPIGMSILLLSLVCLYQLKTRL